VIIGGKLIHAALGEMPVVAVATAVIAARRADPEDAGPGQHVEAGLFLDRINLQGTGTAVDQVVVAAAQVDLIAAEPPLSWSNDALSETQLALNAVVLKATIEAGFVKRGRIIQGGLTGR